MKFFQMYSGVVLKSSCRPANVGLQTTLKRLRTRLFRIGENTNLPACRTPPIIDRGPGLALGNEVPPPSAAAEPPAPAADAFPPSPVEPATGFGFLKPPDGCVMEKANGFCGLLEEVMLTSGLVPSNMSHPSYRSFRLDSDDESMLMTCISHRFTVH